ncbi:hypothetical protein EV126DRAFT_424248 [Verticillium dahliae]|nr:hypothetical protein EV126DRAFT_424248 [Verticillium dahliae]
MMTADPHCENSLLLWAIWICGQELNVNNWNDSNHQISGFASNMVPARKRDRTNENFLKRWNTFVVNGLKMHRKLDADVCILVRRRGKHYMFRSTPTLQITSEEEIVSPYC